MASSNAEPAVGRSATFLNLPWNEGMDWHRALSPESRCSAAELEICEHRHNKAYFEQLPHTQKAGIAKSPQLMLTFVIDDALLAARTRGQCVFNVKTLVLLLTALVFFLSWDKCQFVPVQRVKFPGLEVNSKNCRMFVPADKKLYIKEITGSPHVHMLFGSSKACCLMHIPSTAWCIEQLYNPVNSISK